MAKFSKVERVEKMGEALELSARGNSVSQIAEALGVSWPTAKKLIDDELANRAEHRNVGDAREESIATYQAIIKEGWKRLETMDNRSLNVSGVLNSIKSARERIDKLTGAEAPVKHQNVEEVTEVVWDDVEIPSSSEAQGSS